MTSGASLPAYDRPSAPPADEVPATGPAGRTVPWVHPQLALLAIGGAGGLLVGAGAALGPAAGVAALLAGAGAAAIALRPLLGLLVLAGVVPVISGLQRGLPLPGLRLSEVVATGVAVVVLLRLDARTSPPWRAFDWAAVAYAVGNVLTGSLHLLSRGEAFSATALGTLFGPFQFLLLYRAALSVLHNEDRRALTLRVVLVASLGVSALALLQRLGVAGVGGLMTALTGVDAQEAARAEALAFGRFEETLRTTGPFPHWQVLAGYLFVVSVIAVGLLLESEQRVMRPRRLAVVLAAATGGMVASGTFTTTLGLVGAALLLGAWARRLLGVLAATAVGGALAAGLFWTTIAERVDQQFFGPGSEGGAPIPQSVAYRFDLWTEQLLPLLDGHWLTGYGPALPPGLFFPYTESVYLTLLLRGGVVLLALYALVMIALGASAASEIHDREPLRRTVARVLLVLVAILVPFHMIEPYFLTTGMPHLIWLLAAVALAGGACAHRAPAPGPG